MLVLWDWMGLNGIYPLVSSNMAGKSSRNGGFWLGKSLINGPCFIMFPSYLITGGYLNWRYLPCISIYEAYFSGLCVGEYPIDVPMTSMVLRGMVCCSCMQSRKCWALRCCKDGQAPGVHRSTPHGRFCVCPKMGKPWGKPKEKRPRWFEMVCNLSVLRPQHRIERLGNPRSNGFCFSWSGHPMFSSIY